MIREYKRICKAAGCNKEFSLASALLAEDRALGLSDPEYCPEHRLLQAKSYSRVACHHIELELTDEGFEAVRTVEQRRSLASAHGGKLLGAVEDPWSLEEGYGPGGIGRFQRPARFWAENDQFQPKTGRRFAIAEKMGELLEKLDASQVVVLVGKTGSGKSTYVPWHLLTGGRPGELSKWARRGPICVTQPRIQATQKTPGFIANGLNGTSLGIGSQIGYAHSLENAFDRRARLVFKTDGKLINEILSGQVASYSVVMIDEAHERSPNIDLILALMRKQLYLYPHLRLIIASATIDIDTFQGYFGGPQLAPLVEAEGVQYPVERHFWNGDKPDWWAEFAQGPAPARATLPQKISELIKIMSEKNPDTGHILVFMPGAQEIDQTVSLINALNLPNTISLPLYAQRPMDEQQAALDPDKDPVKCKAVIGKRRIVVSTNVAETSLTVEGIKVVIDSGYIKEAYWNDKSRVMELQTLRHSQAGIKQRWGRAGRERAGDAYALYTQEEFDALVPHTLPALTRASLEEVVLKAKCAGVGSRRVGGRITLDLDWLPMGDPVVEGKVREETFRACESLIRYGAMDAETGDLTELGLELHGFPAPIRFARLFGEAERHGMGVEAAALVPFLQLEQGLGTFLSGKTDAPGEKRISANDKRQLRRRHLDLVFGCDDDLDLYFKIAVLADSFPNKPEKLGLDAGSFHRNVRDAQEGLLRSAKDWRKSEDRPLSIARLDAFRALAGAVLGEQTYRAIEIASEEQEKEQPDQLLARLASPDLHEWQAFWGGESNYLEYDEDVYIDESSIGVAQGRCGVFLRAGIAPDHEQVEINKIELLPTSLCAARAGIDWVVVGQRRANYMQPQRAKVLGVNVVRIPKEWFGRLDGTLAERCHFLASLSRNRDPEDHRRLAVRLFLPWLAPRAKTLEWRLAEERRHDGAARAVASVPRAGLRLGDLPGHDLEIEAWIPPEHLQALKLAERPPGTRFRAAPSGYRLDTTGNPYVTLAVAKLQQEAWKRFRRTRRPGQEIEVEMVEVLEDPLRETPLFMTREPESGLEVVLTETDVSGGSRPRAYFGRAFAPGERLPVVITAMDKDATTLRLSYGPALWKAYHALCPDNQSQIVTLRYLREDAYGVYLREASGRSSYTLFVRQALWPAELMRGPGRTYTAQIVPARKQMDEHKIEEMLEEGRDLPAALDLNVTADLLLPLAYDRFRKQDKRGKVLPPCRVERILDWGGLVISLNHELRATVPAAELPLDEHGKLRLARSFELGQYSPPVRVTNTSDRTLRVYCSLLQAPPLPAIEEGAVVTARMLRKDSPPFLQGDVELTCSFPWNGKHLPARVTVDSAFARGLREGSTLRLAVKPPAESGPRREWLFRGEVLDEEGADG